MQISLIAVGKWSFVTKTFVLLLKKQYSIVIKETMVLYLNIVELNEFCTDASFLVLSSIFLRFIKKA